MECSKAHGMRGMLLIICRWKKDLDDLIHARVEGSEGESFLQVGPRPRITAHGLIVFERLPLSVHGNFSAVDAAMETGGDESGGVADGVGSGSREEFDEPLLVGGVNGKNVDEGNKVVCWRDGRHR